MLLVIFLLTLVFPLAFQIGTLALSPSRLLLGIVLVPLLIGWVSGRYGGFRSADFFLLGFVFWLGLSYLINTGSKGIEFVGISTIETFGAYLLGRAFVRSASDLNRVSRALFVILLFILPAAIIESVTTIRIYSQLIEMIGTTFAWVDYPPRFGLFRAQVVFEHPILYGIFCAMSFSLLYTTINEKTGRMSGLWRGWVSIANTFFSLSSGALLALTVQIGLITWEKTTRFLKNRWWVLVGLAVTGYVVVDLLSNRTPFEVFASYMTFNSGTAYYRILIFEYGIQNVWDNPIFGLGNRGWVRPSWMMPSVDNLWLLTAMRYGIPGFALFALAFASATIRLALLKLQDPHTNSLRRAMVYTFVGIALGVATVHLWGATYTFLMFMLGAVGWFKNSDGHPVETETNSATETAPAQTRFQRQHLASASLQDRPARSRYTRQRIQHDR